MFGLQWLCNLVLVALCGWRSWQLKVLSDLPNISTVLLTVLKKVTCVCGRALRCLKADAGETSTPQKSTTRDMAETVLRSVFALLTLPEVFTVTEYVPSTLVCSREYG